MKGNLKLFSSFIILSTLSALCTFSVPAWSCSPSPPVAALEISPDPARTGQTVLLDGSGSYTSSGYITKYAWDFTADGIYDYYETPTYYPDGAFDGKTTHIYTYPYTYTARLHVTNSYNYSDTDTDTVVVINAPVAVLDISPDPVVVGHAVLLDGSDSHDFMGSITKYEWDFTNDGSYDYEEILTDPPDAPDGAFDGKTTHIYNEVDTYTAKLRVTNSYGYSDTDTDTVVVNEPTAVVVYTYDEVGNRDSMTDPTGTTSYTYDYLNRLISVTNPDLKTISYQYDAGGNRTQLTDPSENITTYDYDDNNRLIEVDAPAGSTTYQYDSLGNLTRVDYPNGNYTEYSYNPQRNWLVSLVNKNSIGTALSSYSYTCDNAGNRLSVTENDGSVVSYTYDNIYQLDSETRTGPNPYTITYQYDSVGNRTQMTKDGATTYYYYNNNNQLTTDFTVGIPTFYSYDDNGNLVSKTSGGNTTVYTWDWRDLLLSVSEPGGNTSYEYDGDGTRISKTQNEVETKYINDVALPHVQVLMETDNTGTVQATYTYGNDLISMNKASVNSYYHYDGLGSTRQLTDSSGAVVANYTYDSFGNVISQTTGGGTASNPAEKNEPINKTGVMVLACFGLGIGAVTIRNKRHGLIILLSILLITTPIPTSMAIEVDVTGNPYGFTGEQQFGEANDLVFLRARYYNTRIGRFISRDPIGYAGGLNLYAYVKNNPINYVDPRGEALIHIVIGGIVIGTIIWWGFKMWRCKVWADRFIKKTEELEDKHTDPTTGCVKMASLWKELMKTKEAKKMLKWCHFTSIALPPGLPSKY